MHVGILAVGILALAIGLVPAVLAQVTPQGTEGRPRSPDQSPSQGPSMSQMMRGPMGLIRFRGHIPKGGYDVHDGQNNEAPASAPAVD